MSVKQEYKYIYEDRSFDFDNPLVDNADYESEFSNIDIDISDDMLEMLIRRSAEHVLKGIKPCSLDIWNQKYELIEDVPALQSLVGECLINDILVDAIIAGCVAATGWRAEPYYKPKD